MSIKKFFHNYAMNLIIGFTSFASATGTAIVGAHFLGLFRGTERHGIPGVYEREVYWIIDQGMVAVLVSIVAAEIAANIASKNASVKHAALLSFISGVAVAVPIVIISKLGLTEGFVLAIPAIAIAVGVGYWLRNALKRRV